MIRIGPAGIPLSCKGRTIKDGVIYTRNLELDAIQVQFVRGIRTTEEEALEVGRVAAEAGVQVHLHAPYYTNLAGDEKNLQMTFEKIIAAAALGDAMDAKTLAVHPGLYNGAGAAKTMELVVKNLGELLDTFKEKGIGIQIALEPGGKKALFGTWEEILEVCRQVPQVVPIFDFPHIHARGNGSLVTREDFEEVFDAATDLGLKEHLIHFTGVLYENGSERHHMPIKKGDLRFEPLIEIILDRELDVTLISHSPILEHDAMYMKIVLDRVRERRELKEARERAQKQQEEERRVAREAREKAREAAAVKRRRQKAKREKDKATTKAKAPAAAKAPKGGAAKKPAKVAKKKTAKATKKAPKKAAQPSKKPKKARSTAKKPAKKNVRNAAKKAVPKAKAPARRAPSKPRAVKKEKKPTTTSKAAKKKRPAQSKKAGNKKSTKPKAADTKSKPKARKQPPATTSSKKRTPKRKAAPKKKATKKRGAVRRR